MLSLSSDNSVLNSFWPVLAMVQSLVSMLLHRPLHEMVCRWELFREGVNKNLFRYKGKGVYIFPFLDNRAGTITTTPIKLWLKSVRMPHTLLRHFVVSNITRPPFIRYLIISWAKNNFWVDYWLKIWSFMLGIVITPYCFWVTSLNDFLNVYIFKGSRWSDSRDTDRVRLW